MKGACYCRGIGYETQPPFGASSHCHCEDCRKSHSAPLVTWSWSADFRFHEGEGLVRWYESHPGAHWGFCSRCGTSFLCRYDEEPGRMYFTLASLDEPFAEPRPTSHLSYEERVPWFEFQDSLPKYRAKTKEEFDEPQAGVHFRRVTRENLSRILKLEVREDQRKLVASNAISLACAPYYPTTWYRAIYDGEEPVGFIMNREIPEKGEYLLLRLLIDAKFQRKGYGTKAMRVLIDRVKALPRAKALLTRHEELEGSAGPFYEKLGFRYTGEKDEDGELIMRLDLT